MAIALVPLFLLLLSSAAAAQAEAGEVAAAAEAAYRRGQEAVHAGDFPGGIEAFRRVTRLDSHHGRGWLMLGYCLHSAGRLDEALSVHEKALEFPEVAHIAAYNVACVHSLRGEKDSAFAWLDRAVELGFGDLAQLTKDSDLDNIRDDPRYARLATLLESGVRVFAATTDRRSARVAFLGPDGSPGQIAIDHAVLPWQERYEGYVEAPRFVGRWWRLGGDFWTTLDNSMPLQVGGVQLPAGYWYLTLMHQGNRRFVLGVHDPDVVRKLRIDPSLADRLPRGLQVPLHHSRAEHAADELRIRITLPPGQHREGTLRIDFGHHRLTAPVRVQLER